MISGLGADSDPDGDGFSTGRELNQFAFDPLADPTRFNPLVADVPEVDIELEGLSIALFDTLDQTDSTSLGRVQVNEGETFNVKTNRQTTSTTQSHTLGAEVSGGVGKGDGAAEKPAPKYGVEGKISYQYTNSTTKENTKETSSGTRNLHRSEVSEIREQSKTRSIQSGSLAVTAKVRNSGHVGFKVADIGLVLDSRGADGTPSTFGGFQPDLKAPVSIPPGQERKLTFNLGDIGATDALALAEDLSSLVLSVGSLRLSEIGRDGFQADTGDFAQYQDRIQANTAAVSLDLGAGRPSETHLISTSFRRGPDGRPAGTSLCEALSTVLGQQLRLSTPRTLDFGEGRRGVIPVLEALRPFGEDAIEAGPQQYFITNVAPQSTGGRSIYGIPDVVLRGRQAAQLVLYRDGDSDTLEARQEELLRSKDSERDTDGDGLEDNVEALITQEITTQRLVDPNDAGRAVRSENYRRFSSPAAADTDGDGASDKLEREGARGSDPDTPDTDGDGASDQGPNTRAGGLLGVGARDIPGVGDQQPLTVGPMRDYRFEAGGAFGFFGDTQNGPDRLRLAPPGGSCPTERVQRIDDRFGRAASAVKTSPEVNPQGEPPTCQLLKGEPLTGTSPLGGLTTGAMTVIGYAKLDPATITATTSRRTVNGTTTTTTRRQVREQWLAGVPGFFAFQLRELGGTGDTNPDLFTVSVISTACDIDDRRCPDRPPFELQTEAVQYASPGFLPVAMTARSARREGKDGTILRIEAPVRAEKFVEGLRLDRPTPCRLLLGARTRDCDARTRDTQGDSAPLGLGLDDLRIFRYAMTPQQIGDSFQQSSQPRP